MREQKRDRETSYMCPYGSAGCGEKKRSALKYSSMSSSLQANLDEYEQSQELSNLLVRVDRVLDREMKKSGELSAKIREMTQALEEQRKKTEDMTKMAMELQERNRDLEKKLKALPEIVKGMRVNRTTVLDNKMKTGELSALGIRLAKLRKSNGEGKFLWKIPEFSQRMKDAYSGKTRTIHSSPFYTSRCGYRMCLKIYLLGYGIGTGTHMSLFFVMTRGVFDNDLQWPFSNKVTFRLIHQDEKNDVVETVCPNPMRSSSNSPPSERKYGSPHFFRLADLKTKGFIVDDSIYIQCIVDS